MVNAYGRVNLKTTIADIDTYKKQNTYDAFVNVVQCLSFLAVVSKKSLLCIM